MSKNESEIRNIKPFSLVFSYQIKNRDETIYPIPVIKKNTIITVKSDKVTFVKNLKELITWKLLSKVEITILSS